MAQQLASQSSWADIYAPTPSATTGTPVASNIDEEEQRHLQRDEDPFEPPPSYEESRTTQGPSSNVQPAQDNAIKGFGVGFWRADGTPLPPLPLRNYSQHETSQSITGTFTFHDLLDLSTQSGSINIVLDPQPGNTTAVLRLASASGSIKVKLAEEYMNTYAVNGVLDRAFDVQISTVSGSQAVELPIGNAGTTSLKARSGSIQATFLASGLGNKDNVSTLITETESGSQAIKVKAYSRESITSLAAKHHAKGSSSIKVSYPDLWEGMVHASSGGASSVDVKGKNLHFQRNGNREVYAWRLLGDQSDDSKRQGQVVEVRTDGSGSIKVDCSAS